MAGRPSRLKDPEFCKLVAELYIRGVNKDEMAEEFDCDPQTISRWVRDPRVQAHATRMTAERINRITRRIDSEMEARLAGAKNWKIDELIKVRTEYLKHSIKATGGNVNTADTTAELSEAMDQSPDLAAALQALIEGRAEDLPDPDALQEPE